jgi:hypothetical protein
MGKTLGTGVAAILLLAGLTTGAQGQVPGRGLGSFGGELRGITQFTGRVVCVGCSLEEAREAQPDLTGLYQLSHDDGQVVMKVESFSDSAEHRRWESIVGLSHQLWVRAAANVFDELTAEEHLFQEMTITGLLRSTRTLDIDSVRVSG